MRRSPQEGVQAGSAFTLLELLVVLAIIGILTAVALPSLKGLQKSNVMTSASQQLVDDLSLARQYAIKERTTVHVIFVPPDMELNTKANTGSERDMRMWTNLVAGSFTTYAIFGERTVGDQPGQPHFRYLSKWKSLPDGVLIAPWEFYVVSANAWDSTPPENRPLKYGSLHFPTSTGTNNFVPHIEFDAKGSLVVTDSAGKRVFQDEILNLARGSVLYQRNAAGLLVEPPDVRESPPNNSIENYNRIRIDGLTGRAKVERLEVKL